MEAFPILGGILGLKPFRIGVAEGTGFELGYWGVTAGQQRPAVCRAGPLGR